MKKGQETSLRTKQKISVGLQTFYKTHSSVNKGKYLIACKLIMNPQIGDRCRGRDIGKEGISRSCSFEWTECPICKTCRWVRVVHNIPISIRCRRCNNGLLQKGAIGRHSPSWKGGRKIHGGYIKVYLYPDDFFYPMADIHSYVFEHRLVMAKHLGRNLHLWEIVHHKHTKYPAGSVEDKQDNRIENLQLVSDDKHKQISILEGRITCLEQRLKELSLIKDRK